MTRCDYDTIFQRVFCVALVIIAFTFTVILTNVFVDIDGLLSRKDKVKTSTDLEPSFESEKYIKSSPNELAAPPYYKQEMDFEESDDNYRSKRSLESQNFLFRIRNPKMKGILTSRLATLLEELDAEESNGDKFQENRKNSNNKVEYFAKEPFDENQNQNRKELKSNHEVSNSQEDLLHLAMHNILLQGIIGHMDLSEVYRKVHMLIDDFKTNGGDGKKHRHELRKQAKPIKVTNEIKEENINQRVAQNIENIEDKIRLTKTNNENQEIDNILITNSKQTAEEQKFLEEMAGCDKLQSDVEKMAKMKKIYETEKSTGTRHLPNVLIKTIIDITSLNKTHKHANVDSKERVKGIIKLIYNGKAIQFSKMDEDGADTRRFNNHATSNRDAPQKKDDYQPIGNTEFNDAIEILQEKRQDKSEAFINEFLSEYLIKDPQKFNSFVESVDTRHNYKAKRYKRQIKIRYQDVDVDKKKDPKKFSLAKTNDDELYVEIETHFDSKGMKGEKKKKLIRNLIDKIQKAIHSDPDLMKEHKKRKHRRYHIKKRTQNPLVRNKTVLITKVRMPSENIAERHSDPLSKTLTASQQNHISHTLADKTGETWKKEYTGPGFLTVAKSVNSAEMGEVNINYDKMQDIPPRQQIPLNTDIVESVETPYTNSFFNTGDLKFFIKDIDGTGLSIGFNQFTDEAPDPETMKIFTGIENMVDNYNQNEDLTKKADQMENHSLPASEENPSNHHVLIRRSIKEINDKDYHSNEYRIIFNGNFLPYKNYEEVIDDKNKRFSSKMNKEANSVFPFKGKSDEADFRQNIKLNELPALIGDNIFNKKLKPSEILHLASMINRKKRGATKELTKRKMKVNKYINRRSSRFSPKKLILSKKRSKRQIDKIRIIATDNLNNVGSGKESEENIFVVSNENIFTDRAMVRNLRKLEHTGEGINDAMRDIDLRGQRMEESLPHIVPYVPYVYEEPEPSTMSPYRYRIGNALMSRYPHIIMEKTATSNEKFDPLLVSNMQMDSMKIAKQNDLFSEILDENTETTTTATNAESLLPKQNYKLTVRILPRNASDMNSGFKEIHTIINKSFNRNGKKYSSLFNVSEISKIETINTTSSPKTTQTTTTVKPCIKKRILEQQAKMDLLLKQHRKRIDEQLEQLKAERNNIEALAFKTMLVKPKETLDDTKNPVSDFDLNQLLAFIKINSPIIPQPTTTTTTTPAPDLEKLKVMNTIKRNENLTNEILHQIMKNTELLQTFLMKLSDKMQKDFNDKTKEVKEEVKPTLLRTDKIWQPFTNEQFNETQSPIPFVYAFQHPYLSKAKPDKIPHDNVVYRGLIHTLNNNKIPGNKEEIMNQTKYFIDDVENNFKDVANIKPTVLKPNNMTSVTV